MYNPIPASLSKTLEDISHARLSSYRGFFLPQNDNELYGLYCWNEVLSSCFMRLIGSVEVTLRNRIHLVLSQHIARTIHAGNRNVDPDSNDWYKHVGLGGKSSAKVMEITHNRHWDKRQQKYIYKAKPAVSPNSVISGMTFGFWAPILDLPLPWDSLLPQIIPNHRYAGNAAHWRNQAHVGQIYERIVRVGDIRNRVAHFEPLWKLKNIPEEKRQQRGGAAVNVEFPAPTNEDEALARLNMLYHRVQQLLYWLSKERAEDFVHSELHQTTQWLMTKEALSNFKQGYQVRRARLGSISKSWGMKLVLMEQKPIHIYHNSKIVGRYYPTP